MATRTALSSVSPNAFQQKTPHAASIHSQRNSESVQSLTNQLKDLLANPSKISDFSARAKKHAELFSELKKLDPTANFADFYSKTPSLGEKVLSFLEQNIATDSKSPFEKRVQDFRNQEASIYSLHFKKLSVKEQVAIQQDASLAASVPSSSSVVNMANKCAFTAVNPHVTLAEINTFVLDVEKNPGKYPLLDPRQDMSLIKNNAQLEDRVLFSYAKFKGYGSVEVTDLTGEANKATGRNTYAYQIDDGSGPLLRVNYTTGHWSHKFS